MAKFVRSFVKIQLTAQNAQNEADSLTCDGFNGFTGDRLANEIILDEAGGLRRDLH